MIRTLRHILLVFLTIFFFSPSCGNVREYIEQERRPESPSIGNPNFLEFIEGFEGTSEYRLLEISALATVTMAGNERYLYAGARSDNAILVFNISDAQLEHIQTIMDVDSPAYHLEEVNELITFQVNEQHYVATSSFKESGFNIFEVGTDGKLTIIDSRADTEDINLKYTSYLHVVTHGTDTFLIVGSGVLEHSVLEGKGLSIYKFENDEVTLESTVPLNSNELLPLIADIRSIQTTSTSDPVIFVGSMDRQDNSLLTSYRMDSSGAMTYISSIRHDDVVSEGSVETDDFGYGRPNRYGFYAISALEIFSANENAPVFLLVAGDRIGSVSLFEVSRTDGSLRHIVSILWDFDNGRQEFVSGIFNLLHIYYADTSYLLFPNNTYSMGIYRASASGLDYVNVMYAMPGLHLRNVRAIASVHIDGRYYVFTAGSDRGIGMFKMNGEDDGATLIPIFDPICTNGTPSMVKVFTTDTEKCVSCDSGFGLDGELCREEFDPICTNGTPSTAKVFFANTEKCVSCNSGFDLNGELCREEFDPICTNGIISTAKVFTANTEKCASCDNYYALRRDESCTPVIVETLAGTGTTGTTGTTGPPCPGTTGTIITCRDGIGSSAQFNYPRGVAVDSVGNVYVADENNQRIRKITSAGVVSTFASGFNKPQGLAVDSLGNVYVADKDNSNHRIWKIITNSMGVVEVSSFAGAGSYSFADGIGSSALFRSPGGVAVDGSGNVYVADTNNNRIRKITTDAVGVVSVSTLAGTGAIGDMDGMGNVAQFWGPGGVAVDGSGNVYVADTGNNRIQKITSAGVVSTLASGFNSPGGVAVDGLGFVYVADMNNHRIQKITSAGVVTTLVGTATSGFMDGAGNVAKFNKPRGVAVDSLGNVYVADYNNHRIRKIIIELPTLDPICTNGTPSTAKVFFANTEKCASCNSGFSLDGEICGGLDPICTNGTPSTAKVFFANTEKCASCDSGFDINGDICGGFDPICTNGTPSTVKVPTANTEKCVSCDDYYTFKSNETCAPVIVETFAGTGTAGFMNGAGNVAQFYYPIGVEVDGSGFVYVVDTDNQRIRKITSGGVVSTLAGTGTAGFMDGAGNMALFSYPRGVAVDSSGNVYVADQSNHRIREITSAGVVTTLAGTNTAGFMDGAGNVALFRAPGGVAIDSSGNIYVGDQNNHRIRKITSTGVVSTLAGTGTAGNMDGAGNAAQFSSPGGVAVDGSGNVYVADTYNHRIRKITSTGVVSTLTSGFFNPRGVEVDSSGNVYVADASNHRIRKITSAGVVTTLAGTTGTSGFMDGAGNVAQFNKPYRVAVDSSGNIYVADTDNHRIRKIIIPQ